MVQNDTDELRLLKKNLKKKKRRLKEQESRECSHGQNDEAEASEPPSKKTTTENGKGEQSTGTCIKFIICQWRTCTYV